MLYLLKLLAYYHFQSSWTEKIAQPVHKNDRSNVNFLRSKVFVIPKETIAVAKSKWIAMNLFLDAETIDF